MKKENSNRTRIIGLRLSPEEYAKIEKKWKATTCRKLSDYVRRSLFDKPIVTTYRNSSQDDLMAELTKLRGELNAIGNNLNQAVKKLHAVSQVTEYKGLFMALETEKEHLENTVNEIRNTIKKILELWLQ